MHLSLAQNSNVTDEYGSLRTSKKNTDLILYETYLTLSLQTAFGVTADVIFKASDIPN